MKVFIVAETAAGDPAPVVEAWRARGAVVAEASLAPLEQWATTVVAGPIAGLTRRPPVAGRIQRTIEASDLLVVLLERIEFRDAGGDVLRQLTAWAEPAGTPVVALARHVRISTRELRTVGVEVAYEVDPGPTGEEALARVAGTWCW